MRDDYLTGACVPVFSPALDCTAAAAVLRMDEAMPIAANIAKLPR